MWGAVIIKTKPLKCSICGKGLFPASLGFSVSKEVDIGTAPGRQMKTNYNEATTSILTTVILWTQGRYSTGIRSGVAPTKKVVLSFILNLPRGCNSLQSLFPTPVIQYKDMAKYFQFRYCSQSSSTLQSSNPEEEQFSPNKRAFAKNTMSLKYFYRMSKRFPVAQILPTTSHYCYRYPGLLVHKKKCYG